MPQNPPKWLFVCSRNAWRSRTAEAMYRNDGRVRVRSAGTSPQARIRVSERMLFEADTVFVMEDRHRQKLLRRFGASQLAGKIVVLEIPDRYTYMDVELQDELRDTVAPYLPD